MNRKINVFVCHTKWMKKKKDLLPIVMAINSVSGNWYFHPFISTSYLFISLQRGSQEQWTKALKYMLTNLKWGTWISMKISQRNFSNISCRFNLDNQSITWWYDYLECYSIANIAYTCIAAIEHCCFLSLCFLFGHTFFSNIYFIYCKRFFFLSAICFN